MTNLLYFSTVSAIVMFFCGLWSFVSYHKHLLSSLLSLEFMMLGVFWLLVENSTNIGSEVYFGLFFLTMAVCDGALGLALLVLIVRIHGNDYFKSFNMLEC